MLVKNEGVERVVETLVQIEDRFNHIYHYPYTFLSREPFTEAFKKRTANVVSSKVLYGVIPAEHWNQPDHIEEEKFSASREKMERSRTIYGDSVELLNENRWNSGFFFRHEPTRRYRYSWRIDPGAKVFCEVEEDPFMYLQENNKIYGFTMSSYEFIGAVPGLWDTVNGFFQQYPHLFAFPHAMEFISDDHGRRYNRCHFWNSFDIADMNFWRSEAYTKYFEYMDASGGFYYERWRSGPVQSIAVSLLARKDQIHFFKEIGYRSGAFQRCPQGYLHQKGRCWCDQNDKGNFDYSPYVLLCPLLLTWFLPSPFSLAFCIWSYY
ncbi:glycosyltransferase family 15 protein [Serendipita vermifera]|nr:glycosyltransferase family 15 protein [Serendipita vermifera]